MISDECPDGQQLAVRDVQGELFLIRAEGKDRRPITRGMKAKASWSPDGKRLALGVIGRDSSLKDSQGLEVFLPPVGKEDAALSDAESIERYFQQVLALGPKVLGGNYQSFLEAYATFLCRQEREKEAVELDGSSASIPQRRIRPRLGVSTQRPEGMSVRPAVPAGMEARSEVFFQAGACKRQHWYESQAPTVPQNLPSLYIVEVPDRVG